MTKCKYDFSEYGIREMYFNSLDMIFSALCGENPDFALNELDINISIGDKEISVPINADSFEMLFSCLKEIDKDIKGDF